MNDKLLFVCCQHTWTLSRVECELVNSEASVASLALQVDSVVPLVLNGHLTWLPLRPRRVQCLRTQIPQLDIRKLAFIAPI